MTQAAFAIVMTGLPASGKTTLGRAVARALDLSFLDKDDFLERFYADGLPQTMAERRALSRRADVLFQAAAQRAGPAVLVSHWRVGQGPGGTPTSWLPETFGTLVQVLCRCSVEAAVDRFKSRQRHPGHLDHLRDASALVQQMRSYADDLPVPLGEVVEAGPCQTELPKIIRQIAARLPR